jgi:hypothetical protein
MSGTTDRRPPRAAGHGAPGGPPPRAAGRATPGARPRRRRRPGPGRVVAGSLALFLMLFALLAWQMRNGGDPALGAGSTSVAARPPHVLVHRVVRRVVIVHAPAAAAAAPPAAAPSATAPAAAAPPPAAPAPAPPPAPVVTRAS